MNEILNLAKSATSPFQFYKKYHNEILSFKERMNTFFDREVFGINWDKEDPNSISGIREMMVKPEDRRFGSATAYMFSVSADDTDFSIIESPERFDDLLLDIAIAASFGIGSFTKWTDQQVLSELLKEANLRHGDIAEKLKLYVDTAISMAMSKETDLQQISFK